MLNVRVLCAYACFQSRHCRSYVCCGDRVLKIQLNNQCYRARTLIDCVKMPHLCDVRVGLDDLAKISERRTINALAD